MNILFLSLTYPDAAHPMRGTFNGALCRALGRQHDVRVLAPRTWMDAAKNLVQRRSFAPVAADVAAGVQVRYPSFYYLPRWGGSFAGECLTQSLRRAVNDLTRNWRPDAVVSYWADPDGAAGLRIARQFNVPSVVIIGGSDVLILPKTPAGRKRVEPVLRGSSAVVTVSDGLREACITLGAAAERVHTIRQGVDAALFNRGSREAARRALRLEQRMPHFLWVGRMVGVKRLDVLLDAAERLAQTQQDFRLLLVGNGPLAGPIRERVIRRKLTKQVRLAGAVPPEHLGTWYRAADATVLSSDSEGIPNVLRESLACGTPFVATDVGSIREIGDERCRLLVPQGDADALARGMTAILAPVYRIGAGAFEVRTWSHTAAELSGLLAELREPGRQAKPDVRALAGVH